MRCAKFTGVLAVLSRRIRTGRPCCASAKSNSGSTKVSKLPIKCTVRVKGSSLIMGRRDEGRELEGFFYHAV